MCGAAGLLARRAGAASAMPSGMPSGMSGSAGRGGSWEGGLPLCMCVRVHTYSITRARQPSPTLSPTDTVPRGQIWPTGSVGAGHRVSRRTRMHVHGGTYTESGACVRAAECGICACLVQACWRAGKRVHAGGFCTSRDTAEARPAGPHHVSASACASTYQHAAGSGKRAWRKSVLCSTSSPRLPLCTASPAPCLWSHRG